MRKREIMKNLTFRLFAISLLLAASFVGVAAQDPDVSRPLPPGMVGSNPNDPRSKLTAGMDNAGTTAKGMRHVLLLKKPDAFQIKPEDVDTDRVKKVLGSIGLPDPSMIPKPMQVMFAGLAFANSDLAFQGNHLFMGNFYGMNIYDISDPGKARLVTSILCPGGQGDVSVYQNLMFMSVEMPNGRIDCGDQGFPAEPVPPSGQMPTGPAPQKERFRGVRIFDISDISKPKQVAAVQTCRGSHTHTLVTDPKDKNTVYIYVSGASFVRPAAELAGCSDAPPDKDPNTALFRIEVIKVPVAAPQTASVVSTPRIFGDPKTGAIASITSAATHGSGRPVETESCHDITAFPEIGLAAGACSGNGILLDIREPANPKRVEAVNDPNYAYWHSASFSNDGQKVVFTDEWGGGMSPRCRATDPNVWGANAIFRLAGNKLTHAAYYKLPAAQTESENCVAHNGSLVPVPGRDIKVQAWYQGGISVMDFTDPNKPIEIAYFDRGPIDPKMVVMGGHWSAYWYNGAVYASEIARGLDVFELTPTEHLSQNEIDAAKAVRQNILNVQTQERLSWPRNLTVAKAYIDQLERSGALAGDNLTSLRQAIQSAEGSKLNQGDRARLKDLAGSLEKNNGKTDADAARLRELAEILKQPSV
jgi:hypothetical protein